MKQEEKKEFPQTELQAKILDFWSVRGYEEVHAILGNLNVTFKRKPRYNHLGLDYTYLEQFWKESQKEFLIKLYKFANEKKKTSLTMDEIQELTN